MERSQRKIKSANCFASKWNEPITNNRCNQKAWKSIKAKENELKCLEEHDKNLVR
jgi:hypothetical protein